MLPSVGNRIFVAFRLWNTSHFNIEVTSSKARFVGFAFAAQDIKRVPSDIVHVSVYNTSVRRQSLILGYLN